jgi:hypothetical protein
MGIILPTAAALLKIPAAAIVAAILDSGFWYLSKVAGSADLNCAVHRGLQFFGGDRS